MQKQRDGEHMFYTMQKQKDKACDGLTETFDQSNEKG
jgi:hypothetical protein